MFSYLIAVGTFFFFSSRRRHTRCSRDWSSDVCSSDLTGRFATDRLAENWGSWEEMEAKAPEGIPAGRLGQPEEFGDLVAFICSERAAYLTGTVIPLDGGLLRS